MNEPSFAAAAGRDRGLREAVARGTTGKGRAGPSGIRPACPGRGERFERLAREHAPALYGAARRMARNRDDAQDLAQEALLRAYAAFETFAPGTNFRAWLLRILTNGYLSLYRRRQRVAIESWDAETEREDRGQGVRAAPGDEPETAVISAMLDSEIEAALAQLSEGVRLAILLVDVEDLPYAEYRKANTPESLPAGFWQGVGAELDRLDAAAPAKQARPAAPPHPGRPFTPRQRWVLAALILLLAALAAAAGRILWVPRFEVPVRELARLAGDFPIPAGTAVLRTADADRAARWLGQRLGAPVPTVNLALAGARLVEARARPGAREGLLLFRTARGERVALYLTLRPGASLPPLPVRRYEGSPYRVVETAPSGPSVAAWEFEGRVYAAAGNLPLSELLPYAREMDRHCRRRR